MKARWTSCPFLLTILAIKIGYNHVIRGYIDLRRAAPQELLVMPVANLLGVYFVMRA